MPKRMSDTDSVGSQPAPSLAWPRLPLDNSRCPSVAFSEPSRAWELSAPQLHWPVGSQQRGATLGAAIHTNGGTFTGGPSQ